MANKLHKDTQKIEYYHSVACLILELGRKVLFPEMQGLNSPTVTTPISTKPGNCDTSAPLH